MSAPESPSKRVVSNDHQASCRLAAERIATALERPLDPAGPALVLSGGSAPPPLLELLAADEPRPLPWSGLRVFWSDERCVPPADPESNYRMAREILLDRVDVRPENVHRMHGERGPEEGARAYRETLASVFGAERAPRFDVALLGLGRDGHTCSLFPRAATLRSTRTAEPAHSPEGVPSRITLTPAGLAGAALVLFLVSGSAKAPAVSRTLEGGGTPDDLPARAIRPAGEVVWLLDRAAAAELRETRRTAG